MFTTEHSQSVFTKSTKSSIVNLKKNKNDMRHEKREWEKIIERLWTALL